MLINCNGVDKFNHMNTRYFLFLIFIFLGVVANQLFSDDEISNRAGDVIQIALPVVAYSTSLIIKDKKGQYEFYKSFLLNLTTTEILKYTIPKHRPDHKGNHSFPSGHTSSAFQGAGFIQMRYGWKWGVPAYLLASYVGFSRVNNEKHYVEDVAAGAAIGVLSNLIFVDSYEKVEVLPIISNKTFGLEITFHF